METNERKLVVVTGASSGIGLELAKVAAREGYDLAIAADEPDIETAADTLRSMGADVYAMQVDLSTKEGALSFARFVGDIGRPVNVLMANAGRGLGNGFLDQDLDEALGVVDTNITGTLVLLHGLGRQMRSHRAAGSSSRARSPASFPAPTRRSTTAPSPS